MMLTRALTPLRRASSRVRRISWSISSLPNPTLTLTLRPYAPLTLTLTLTLRP